MTNKIMKLEEIKNQIESTQWKNALALYKEGPELEIFVRDVVTAFTIGQNSEELKNAMTTPQGQASVFYALTHAASTGLSLNPAQGEARLATYWNKDAGSYVANMEIDKGGYLTLSTKQGCTVMSDIVYSEDDWTLEKTFDGDKFSFAPNRKERGEMDGAFCAIREKNGTVHVTYMTLKQIEEHRDKYGRRNKQGELNSIWTKSFPEMCLKTVTKKACKALNIGKENDDTINYMVAPVEDVLPGLPEKTLEATPTEELIGEIKKRSEQELKTEEKGNAKF